MLTIASRFNWLTWLLAFGLFVAFAGACGGGGGSGFQNAPGDDGGAGGDADLLGGGDGGSTHILAVSPPTATITIADKTKPATQGFVATLDGQPVTAPVTWTLDTYAQG